MGLLYLERQLVKYFRNSGEALLKATSILLLVKSCIISYLG